MKTLIITFTLFLFAASAFTQNTTYQKTSSQSAIIINVPDLADPASKKWHEAETNYIKKALTAIRNKDEAAWKNTIPEAKRLGAVEQTWLGKHTPDSKKLFAWNMQAYPYVMELMQSDYFIKMEQEQDRKK